MQDVLARAREAFLTHAPFDPAAVRRPILDSWERSATCVYAERVEAPAAEPGDEASPLVRAGETVIDGLWDSLAGEPVSLVLCDAAGVVVQRRTGDAALRRRLDAVRLAPGYSYAEEHVGTNGIGVSLSTGTAATVVGHEHFAEHLEELACAAAPVRHPVTGEVTGVVNLTCRAADAGALLLTAATSLAAQLQAELLARNGREERRLLDAFLETCRRDAGPVVAVSEDVVMLNRPAREALDGPARSALLAALRGGARDIELPLQDGTRVRVSSRPAEPPGGGVVLTLGRASARNRGDRRGPPRPAAAAPTDLVLGQGLAQSWMAAVRVAAGGLLVLAGEPGSGRACLARAALRAARPGAAGCGEVAEVDGASWDGATLPAGPVVVRDADLVLPHLLARLLARGEPTALTTVPLPLLAGLQDVEESAVVAVPPLRERPGDLAGLARALLRRGQHSGAVDPDALALLAAYCWPGGVAELSRVLATSVRGAGALRADQLPRELRTTRRLTPLQELERRAALVALARSRGDKGAAAAALGTSRATLYRRVRTLGLAPLLP
ncbi:MAG: helix-turn-helix domain-containing protein [Mycobacteriales bacterium]